MADEQLPEIFVKAFLREIQKGVFPDPHDLGARLKIPQSIMSNVTANGFSMCRNKHGDTPLLTAARAGQIEMLRALLKEENGVSLEHTNTDGKTALHEAAQAGHADCVRLLLDSKARVDSLKKADWTPLMLACTKESLDVVKELVKNGASLSLVNKDGWTAFHIACREGHHMIVEFLLDREPGCWDTKSKNGRTPLHTAALHGRLETVALLLEKCGYDVDSRDSSGVTPLMDAARGNHLDVIQCLLDKGKSSMEIEDVQGGRAIHHAAQTGANEAIQLLHKRGANIRAVSSAVGLSPLHCAAKEGHAGTLATLLSLGADPTATDKTGKTALDLARQARNGAEAVKLLEKAAVMNGVSHDHDKKKISRTTISHLSQPQDFHAELRQDIKLGLSAEQMFIPSKYHYDKLGSILFEDITQLPEYYLTRVETGILQECAADVMKQVTPDELVELGSGSSTKTRLLLEAMHRAGGDRYVPIEISETALYQAAETLSTDYDWLQIEGYVGNYQNDLQLLKKGTQRRLLTFLGSSLGNYTIDARKGFLRELGNFLRPGDALLMGVDLVKDEEKMVLAYNDAAGVTAKFNTNILNILNRELGANFDVTNFKFCPTWSTKTSGVESFLRAQKPITVQIPVLDMELVLNEGDSILVEISCKFTREGLTQELKEVGLQVIQWYTDSDNMYGLLVATPTN